MHGNIIYRFGEILYLESRTTKFQRVYTVYALTEGH